MRLRSLVIASCAVLCVESIPAQSGAGDPISGTWTGDIGLDLTNRHPIKFELKFDGAAAISGTVTGPGPADFKGGSFDLKTGALKLEVDVKDDGSGAPKRFSFEGTAISGLATGRVTDGAQTGSFRIAKDAGEPAAGSKPGDDVAGELRKGFAEVSGWVSKAADLVPADKYGYQPVKTVRSYGQLIAHIADSYNYYCARAAGRNVEWSDPVEKGKTDKATVVPRLKQALDACNAAYAAPAQIGAALGNVAHTSLHYGNIITYLRLMGMVPPSS
jgi:DinB family protein